MADFAVKVRRIGSVEHHPNADRLDIATIDGYQFIVGRDQHRPGDLGVYIPEGAVLPEWLVRDMGLEGRLAGRDANRVKAVKLRGVLSQGLFFAPDKIYASLSPGEEAYTTVIMNAQEGDDVAAALGVVKWEPPIPREMAGEVEPAPQGIFQSYDIEDIKKYPHIFKRGDMVSMSEKLHGTCCIVAVIDGKPVVSSKGLAAKGLVLKESPNNVYWRAVRENDLFEKLGVIMEVKHIKQAVLYGEVLGVQDLMYGLQGGKLAFRAFDLLLPGGWAFPSEFYALMDRFDVPAVPEVYWGEFSEEELKKHTNGTSKLAGHIREGVVVKSYVERRDPELGRVILKSVSPAYLLRKNGTELN